MADPLFASEEEALGLLSGDGVGTIDTDVTPSEPVRFATEEEALAALGGSEQAQIQPPSLPQSITGFSPRGEDPLVGVDVESGGDFALRARAAFQVSDEDKKTAIENALRSRGIDVDKNPVEIVPGFFPNFIIPVQDEATGKVKRVLLDPTLSKAPLSDLIADLGPDLAGEILPMATGVWGAARMARGAGIVKPAITRILTGKVPQETVETVAPTAIRIMQESVPTAVATAAQGELARAAEGIQDTKARQMFEFGSSLGFDWASGVAMGVAPRFLGRNFGRDIVDQPEVVAYKDAVEQFNRRFGTSYQPTAGTVLMDKDLLSIENYLASQSPFMSADLKRLKNMEAKAIRSAAKQLAADFDPSIRDIAPEDLTPVRNIQQSYLDEMEALSDKSASSIQRLITSATDKMLKEVDNISLERKINSPEQAGFAIRHFIQESKDVFQRKADENYNVVERLVDQLRRDAPDLQSWGTAVDLDGVRSVIGDLERRAGVTKVKRIPPKESKLVRQGLAPRPVEEPVAEEVFYEAVDRGLIPNIPKDIVSIIKRNPRGLPIQAARQLRRKIADALNGPDVIINTEPYNILNRMQNALKDSFDAAVDNMPTTELRDALRKANSDYAEFRDLFKVDTLQKIANTTARGEMPEGQILPSLLGNERAYFDLRKTMTSLPTEAFGSPVERWDSLRKDMLASVLNITDEGLNKVSFKELHDSILKVNPRIRKDLLGDNHDKIIQFLDDMSKVSPRKRSDLLGVNKTQALAYLSNPEDQELKNLLIKASNDSNKLFNLEQKSSFTKALSRLRQDALDLEATDIVKEEGFLSRAIDSQTPEQIKDLMSRIGDPKARTTARQNVVTKLMNDTGILQELYDQGSIKSGNKMFKKLRERPAHYKAVLGEQTFEDLLSFATVSGRVSSAKTLGGAAGGSLALGRVIRDMLTFRFLNLAGDLRMRVGATIIANPRLVQGFYDSARLNPGSPAAWAWILTAPDFLENFRAGYEDTANYVEDLSLIMDAVGMAEGLMEPAPQPEPAQQ
jgi:hypothetical protein